MADSGNPKAAMGKDKSPYIEPYIDGNGHCNACGDWVFISPCSSGHCNDLRKKYYESK